jgi:hypothetical protein
MLGIGLDRVRGSGVFVVEDVQVVLLLNGDKALVDRAIRLFDRNQLKAKMFGEELVGGDAF